MRCGVAKELTFTDEASGAKHQCPGLDTYLEQLQGGDILLVWQPDRLGRSMRHLVTLIDQLREKNIGFRSVCDGAIDTTTPSGELIFHVFSALAQFVRRLIQERTNSGSSCSSYPRSKSKPPAYQAEWPTHRACHKVISGQVDRPGRYLRNFEDFKEHAASLCGDRGVDPKSAHKR